MKIIIIGGGITGLATALALNKLGISCQVFEKAKQLNEVGAGIWMQPNAMKVLDWLDIGDSVRNAGMLMNEAQVTNKNLIPIKGSNNRFSSDSADNKITAIHRARLQRVLSDSLPEGTLFLGMEYKSHEIENDKIAVRFSNSSVKSDILLGADGINSGVRKEIFPDSGIRYSGQTCWRGISNMELPERFKTTGIEAWGNRIRFGFSAIYEKEVYWFAVARSKPGQKDSSERLHGKLTKKFRPFHPLINNIIENTPEEKIIRNDINDLKRLERWSDNNVCLLGDAAHATTPNMGQGACQGIEDAYHISQSLSKYVHYSEAFQQFEKNRRKKVDYIVNASWRFGKMIHNPAGQIVLKLISKLTPEKIITREMKKLYAVENL